MEISLLEISPIGDAVRSLLVECYDSDLEHFNLQHKDIDRDNLCLNPMYDTCLKSLVSNTDGGFRSVSHLC